MWQRVKNELPSRFTEQLKLKKGISSDSANEVDALLNANVVELMKNDNGLSFSAPLHVASDQ